MTRVPVVATAVVALSMMAMIALGLWQLLDRLPAKEAQLAQLARNPALPPIAFPRVPDQSLLFRRATIACLAPVTIARAGAGAAGFRMIAQCRTGAEGPGVKVQLGTTRDPTATIAWGGGAVSGWISHAPDPRPLIAGLFDHRPHELLLVASTPVAGLTANTRPDTGLIPNNHLAYAVQWFFFAGVAGVIYAVALYRRQRPVAAPPERG